MNLVGVRDALGSRINDRSSRWIGGLCLLAFALRILLAFLGPDHFWSYTAYYFVAKHALDGEGFCLEAGSRLCAYFPPVYPLVSAAGLMTGHYEAAMKRFGALLGTSSVWLTWRVGRIFFNRTVGFVAAVWAAFYPYYIWHDTVLQENAILATVVLISILLLVRAHQAPTTWKWFGAGAMVAIVVLTKANLTLYALAVLGWIPLVPQVPTPRRLKWAGVAALGFGLALAPWMIRTVRITGAPILYSNGGFSLWTANHALTFEYYPSRSIDLAVDPQRAALSPPERAELALLVKTDKQGIRTTKWYWERGMKFILANPGLTLRRAIWKVWIAFSPVFSPEKHFAEQALYFCGYFPMLLLAPIGIWKSRARWREFGYVLALIVTFAAGTALFWAHTSHRMYLDPYLMIFAAGAVFSGSPRDLEIGKRRDR